MAFIDELMKLQGNQMGRTPVAPFPATPQATPQAPQGPQVQPQTPTDTIQPQTPTPQTGEGGNILSRGFDFFFGPPTPEQAQQTLTTQPTDPAQRENLQAIVRGEERPSSVGKAASFLFGRPDVAGDPNIMGATKPEAVAPQFGLADTTSSTAPTGEDPFSGPIVQPQVPQADPNQQIRLADPTSSTAGLNPTQAMLQERFGAPTISAIQAAPEGLGMRTDPQGRMIDPNADRSFFEQQSAAREQRAEEQFGVARGPDARDRDTGEMSAADARDMAKLRDPNATEGEKARAMQVAERLGRDPMTGAPVKTGQEGLTFDQVMKMKDFDFKRDQEAYKREQDTMVAEGKAAEAFGKDEALLRQVSGDAGRIGRLTNEAIGVTTEAGTTGLAGSILKHVPGTDAHKLDSILEVVSSKVALDRLMEVKKTGATLGQVSEKELAMLQNSYDTLKQGLKGERLRQALVNYATQLKAVEDKTAKAFIDKHGQEKFDKIMGGGGGSGEPRYANDQDVGDSAESYYNPSK